MGPLLWLLGGCSLEPGAVSVTAAPEARAADTTTLSMRYKDFNANAADVADGGTITLFTMEPETYGYSVIFALYPSNWSDLLTGTCAIHAGDSSLAAKVILLHQSETSEYTVCDFILTSDELQSPPDGQALTFVVKAEESGGGTSIEEELSVTASVHDVSAGMSDTAE